ncbi:MAG TPA: phosphoribosylglycinamide formyltransferase [Deltaproteobacteria bacterium]|nr:phosphoribosylglycinamide formyltransferase [Deltaproteobacteria bacterium]
MTALLNLGVLISGSGSNLQSIIDHIEKGKLKAEIKIVISSNPEALGVKKAKNHSVPVAVLDSGKFASREEFDSEMARILKEKKVNLVILAGFMRILTPGFLKSFPGRIMNIHPALLPSFPGLHGQKQAFEYGVKFSGCTVHFVDEGVDTGPIIIQGVVPCYDDDTEDSLSQRILKEEHRIYPQAIQLFAEGRLQIEGRKVRVTHAGEKSIPEIHNPPLFGF